ncbi:uncharacterized protein BdWA1_003615 [Babesia duncani]|uniref:Uncharacterized protein n=1 Tax=Babesia duncani TaxID=323732 RepID=A0AAD9PI15_9APIC|nr:hypothetical protein BdWA1_003615 [Babesia duncani]
MFALHHINTMLFLNSLIPICTYAAVRNVEFCIEQIGDLTVNFENRVLSLDSGSDCKLKKFANHVAVTGLLSSIVFSPRIFLKLLNKFVLIAVVKIRILVWIQVRLWSMLISFAKIVVVKKMIAVVPRKFYLKLEEFCVCLIKDAKESLKIVHVIVVHPAKEIVLIKRKLKKEILKLCSCSEAKKVVEQAPQKCDSCKGSGSCQCCQEIQKQFESCPCMACDLQQVIDEIKQEDGSNCCSDPSCSCSSGSNCRKRTDVLSALNTYCKCKDQVKQIKEKIEKLCKQCNKNTCCDVKKIEKDIQDICNDCDCKKKKCCNESEINKKVQQVIDEKCTCRKNKCCFRDITDGDLSDNTKKAEKEKLKNIALAIFKYFRPPIAHSTGLMTLKSTADIDLQFSSGSSSSQDNITVDAKNKNVLKIPKQAFKDLMASSQIPQVKVTTFHKNTMLSIHFEEISLTFQKLNGTGFEIDGYPINGTFSMQLGYQPIGPYTKNTANWRNKTSDKSKHDLSWSIGGNYPRIDPSKCSCSILSDPCLVPYLVPFV